MQNLGRSVLSDLTGKTIESGRLIVVLMHLLVLGAFSPVVFNQYNNSPKAVLMHRLALGAF